MQAGLHKSINIPRLMFAAPGSGHGKTTVMAAVAMALREKGLRVAPFKAGPDYLDPTYHEKACGKPCINLDQWLMGREGVIQSFIAGTQGADIALIEGVMGLYDGLEPTSFRGSSWELALTLDCPIVLVVDVSGMAKSAAAVVKGFKEYGGVKQDQLCGVVCNRLGSKSHGALLAKAFGDLNGITYIGGVLGGAESFFPERHLGLVSLRHQSDGLEVMKACFEKVSQGIDLERILEIARSADALPLSNEILFQHEKTGNSDLERILPRCRIGIARDEAFDFYYDYNLDLLKKAGAELVEFSPLRDPCLPRDEHGKLSLDGLYFGGGYPELYARELSENQSMLADIRKFGHDGGFVYGECGGFMYLCQEIYPVVKDIEIEASRGSQGEKTHGWSMVGLLPGKIVMHSQLKALGYVEVETQDVTPLGPAGLRFRGHQFRYSEREILEENPHPPYKLRRRRDQMTFLEGAAYRNVLGTYVHAHWGSNPSVAEFFVERCARAKSAVAKDVK